MHQPTSIQLRYHRGRTPFYACQADQRFSYCLYVPGAYQRGEIDSLPLLVMVHGSKRTAERYRDAMIEFAEQHHCLVLVPLFPVGILGPEDSDSYKLMELSRLRYDRILLAMIDEVGNRYPLAGDRFLLHGFSGGAQFAHRFFYLHPRRLAALSIAAPGQVTLLDQSLHWWQEARHLDRLEMLLPDLEAMRAVPVQMVIGARDCVVAEEGLPELVGLPGSSRMDHLRRLHHEYRDSGIRVRFDQVAEVGHDGFALLEPVRRFFGGCLGD